MQEDQQDSCIEEDLSGEWTRRCTINCYQRNITPKGIAASKCCILGGCPYARKQVIPGIWGSFCSNMQMSTSPMTKFWSTDSAPMWTAFTQSNMQMHEVKAEAVPCLQVGFALYKHMYISISSVSTHVSYLNTSR